MTTTALYMRSVLPLMSSTDVQDFKDYIEATYKDTNEWIRAYNKKNKDRKETDYIAELFSGYVCNIPKNPFLEKCTEGITKALNYPKLKEKAANRVVFFVYSMFIDHYDYYSFFH
jgi:hypothetical protein